MKGDAAPVATAIKQTPFPWLQTLVTLGVIAGFTTVMLVLLYGQSRVFFSMANDGLLPKFFAVVHPTWRTPYRSNLFFMVFAALLGGLTPISTLGHMTSIGTLLAFIIVCAGVVIMRRTHPNEPRGYRVPLVPLGAGGRHPGLPRHDALPRRGDLAAPGRLARDRARDLLRLRAPPQPGRPRRRRAEKPPPWRGRADRLRQSGFAVRHAGDMPWRSTGADPARRRWAPPSISPAGCGSTR